MAYIVVENGASKGRKIEIPPGGSVILGRDPKAEISVEDHLCSRQHLRIEDRSGSFYVVDLGSSNGTYLNDDRVDEAPLAGGDGIQAGETQITFLVDAAQGARGLVGKTVGGYRILDRVGRGGMGTVYKANQVSLNRTVALKILSHKVADDPTFVAKFKREAQAAGRLNHPNIVQCYDVGSDGGLHYYSMEFIENGSVQDLVRKNGRIEPELALAIILDAARGLEYAEKRKLVHRDIKPDNLMVNSEGVVKIADLGLAKETDRAHSIEEEGIFGTPHFISPEQALGQHVDTRSDIYSLGASFYYMLSGETPFDAENVRDIVRKQIEEDPQPLKEKVKGIPAGLSALIAQMMAKDPDKRPKSAEALLSQLEALSASVGAGAKGRGRVIGIAAAGLVAAIVGVITFWPKDKEDPVVENGTQVEQVNTREREAAERRRLLEERETLAMRALHEIQLVDAGLLGSARTPEALKELADKCQELVAAYGTTDTLPAADSAQEATKLLRGLTDEIEAKAAAIQQAAEAARLREEMAKSRADSITKASLSHRNAEEWALAIEVLRSGLRQPEIVGTNYLTELSKEIESVINVASERAAHDLAQANKDFEDGRVTDAIERLRTRSANLRTGFDPQTAPGEVFASAKQLDDRIDAMNKAVLEKRRLDLAHDQKVGFEGRKALLSRMHSSLDTDQLRTEAEALLGSLRTDAWRRAVEQDLSDIAALDRMRARFLAELASTPPDPKKDKVSVVPTSEGEKDTTWDLVQVNDEGVHLERARGRFKRTITWSDWSPADFYRRVFYLRPPTKDSDRRDVAIAHIVSAEAEAALQFLAESDQTLTDRIRDEGEAKRLVDEVRALEVRAEGDAMAYLELLPKLDRVLNRLKHTAIFIRNSDGTTPFFPEQN